MVVNILIPNFCNFSGRTDLMEDPAVLSYKLDDPTTFTNVEQESGGTIFSTVKDFFSNLTSKMFVEESVDNYDTNDESVTDDDKSVIDDISESDVTRCSLDSSSELDDDDDDDENDDDNDDEDYEAFDDDKVEEYVENGTQGSYKYFNADEANFDADLIDNSNDATIKIVQEPTKKEDYTEQMEKIEAMMKRIQGLNDRLKKYQ